MVNKNQIHPEFGMTLFLLVIEYQSLTYNDKSSDIRRKIGFSSRENRDRTLIYNYIDDLKIMVSSGSKDSATNSW